MLSLEKFSPVISEKLLLLKTNSEVSIDNNELAFNWNKFSENSVEDSYVEVDNNKTFKIFYFLFIEI